MPTGLPDPKKLAIYFSLAQVGLEMVMPVVIGLLLDHHLGWKPWGTVVGAILGLVAGMAHLLAILSRQQNSKPPPQDE